MKSYFKLILSFLLTLSVSQAMMASDACDSDGEASAPPIAVPEGDYTSQSQINGIAARVAREEALRINRSGIWRYPAPKKPCSIELESRAAMFWEAGMGTEVDDDGRNFNFGKISLREKYLRDPAFKMTEALDSLRASKVAIDCVVFLHYIGLRVVQGLLGDDAFNRMCRISFAKEVVSEMSLGALNGMKNLYLAFTRRLAGVDLPVPGNQYYIPNAPEYSSMHPDGMAQGQNLYCVGRVGDAPDGVLLYVGFGEFFSEPRTLVEILDRHYEKILEPLPTKYTMRAGYEGFAGWHRESMEVKQAQFKASKPIFLGAVAPELKRQRPWEFSLETINRLKAIFAKPAVSIKSASLFSCIIT